MFHILGKKKRLYNRAQAQTQTFFWKFWTRTTTLHQTSIQNLMWQSSCKVYNYRKNKSLKWLNGWREFSWAWLPRLIIMSQKNITMPESMSYLLFLSVVSHGVSALVALGIALHGFVMKKRTKKLSFYKTCQNCPPKVKEKKTLLASDKMPRLVVDRINNKILVNKNWT